jgi:hypothetical protein
MKPKQDPVELMSEVLVMPDGRIYVHNLTPEMAAVLRELNPEDETISRRVITHVNNDVKKLLPPSWHTKDPGS